MDETRSLLQSPLHQLGPLRLFYNVKGIPLPEVEPLPGGHLPEPARRLLFHRQDMTSQLQDYYRDDILVDVVRKEVHAASLDREVILRRRRDGLPVEYGAIRIHFGPLPPKAQEMVLECRKPLGAILHECAVEFRSCPGCFFRIESDAVLRAAFGLRESRFLYGRCNLLTYQSGHVLANVVEILPPLEQLRKMEVIRNDEQSL